MKKVIGFLAICFVSLNVSAEKCPKVDFSVCPEGFVCKDRPIIKGQKFQDLFRTLKKEEYDKPWKTFMVIDRTKTTRFIKAIRDISWHFNEKMLDIKRRLKGVEKTKGPSETFTKASFTEAENMALQSFNESSDKERIMKGIKEVSKQRVTLSYEDDNGKMSKTKFYIYSKIKKTKKKRPVLLIMPPVYGISPFDLGMAFEYASLGFDVSILELGGLSFVSPFQKISTLNNTMRRVLGDTHRMVQYFIQKRKADPKNFGIFGFSLGGLLASMVYTLNDNITYLSLAMGGGNFPEIFTNSKQAMAKLYRSYRMKKENIKTKEGYFKKIEKALPYDPLSFAYRKNPDNVFFVFSSGDTLVPSKNQWDLSRAFKASCEKGNVRWEKDQHFIAIVHDLLKRNQLRKFFISKMMK
ncbi:MAG: prolyl oligopeptidase family serine peptidase [Bdellovibrionota bacterium]|nr:prolyl oligopeptidase family serine peptidase [Bdellovibrionota bacterium]